MTPKDKRPRKRVRGWGGVAGMAVAVAATAALLPAALHQAPDEGKRRAPQTTHAAPAAATEECKDGQAAEASLKPDGGAKGDAVRRIQDRGQLIAGVDQNSYRWGYRATDGGLQGFDIDLARAIAKQILGDETKVVFRAIPTNQRIPALQQEKVDIVVRTMTINCDRLEDVDFSSEYFRGGQQVMAPKGSGIKGMDDLDGKTVCTAAGSTGEEALNKEVKGAKVLTVDNQLDCLVRVQVGEADAVVTDNALAAGQAAQDPSMSLEGDRFTDEPYGVAVKKGSDDLVKRINKVLADYRKGGDNSDWMKAYRKWLAADLPGIKAPPEPKYRD
ncbi:glutamate ABC transporter substrate-binding protein [Streptomyces sp. A7024]|uniref:Glutamate ABC transporter substrate-binding protein n=2 Tax=Streptomyces coryli TaxID=1128680 RepID=A0A6G4U7J5_9ACTN|nr:glutamate ABC transporter substrate-binding protein [Streptomyces coryli]NGN68154.1 glutamate ABC transporter substrate-binding protein [Streptomyces coryli]